MTSRIGAVIGAIFLMVSIGTRPVDASPPSVDVDLFWVSSALDGQPPTTNQPWQIFPDTYWTVEFAVRNNGTEPIQVNGVALQVIPQTEDGVTCSVENFDPDPPLMRDESLGFLIRELAPPLIIDPGETTDPFTFGRFYFHAGNECQGVAFNLLADANLAPPPVTTQAPTTVPTTSVPDGSETTAPDSGSTTSVGVTNSTTPPSTGNSSSSTGVVIADTLPTTGQVNSTSPKMALVFLILGSAALLVARRIAQRT